MEINKDQIEEGKAKIWLKINLDKEGQKEQTLRKEVFYNPVQIFNRDLSLLVCYTYIQQIKQEHEENKKDFKGVRFYDAMTASGFRKEIPDELIDKVIGCDISQLAIQIFQQNLKLNELENDEKINIVNEDTNKYMYNCEEMEKFDIIDLDPYGSMVPFLYSTLKAFKKRGLLCVTCTDTRVLCGSDTHKCFYLYRSCRGGSDNIKELGIRVVLHTINTIANMLDKNIRVLLSIQSDFYIRVFVEVVKGKRLCWKSIEQNGIQFYCIRCCYQKIHQFGTQKNTGHFKAKKLELESGNCPYCKDQKLAVSNIKRWTYLD